MARKNHFIPAFILRNFKNPEFNSQVSYLILENNIIKDKNITSFNQYFNIKRFYSTDSLNSIITNSTSGIIINPLFERSDLDLEENLSIIESKASTIIDKIVNNVDTDLTQEEINYLKEYFVIQHLRTKKFKEDYAKSPMEFPDDFEEKLLEDIQNVDIDMKKLIKEKHPNKNAKERRELYKTFLKYKKENPNYRVEYLEKKSKEIEAEIQKARNMFNKVFNSDKSHSIFIINNDNRNNFFDITNLDSLNFNILINNTDEEFLLTDAGVLITEDGDEESRKYTLPIMPRICLAFTKVLERKQILTLDSIKEFNRLSKEESMFVIFGNKNILDKIN